MQTQIPAAPTQIPAAPTQIHAVVTPINAPATPIQAVLTQTPAEPTSMLAVLTPIRLRTSHSFDSSQSPRYRAQGANLGPETLTGGLPKQISARVASVSPVSVELGQKREIQNGRPKLSFWCGGIRDVKTVTTVPVPRRSDPAFVR